MTKNGELNGVKYEEHKPGFVIKENSIKYWCDYLDNFPGWERFLPDSYIVKIKKQAEIEDVDDREFIPFETKYLLSVFKTLDSNAYGEVLRK